MNLLIRIRQAILRRRLVRRDRQGKHRKAEAKGAAGHVKDSKVQALRALRVVIRSNLIARKGIEITFAMDPNEVVGLDRARARAVWAMKAVREAKGVLRVGLARRECRGRISGETERRGQTGVARYTPDDEGLVTETGMVVATEIGLGTTAVACVMAIGWIHAQTSVSGKSMTTSEIVSLALRVVLPESPGVEEGEACPAKTAGIGYPGPLIFLNILVMKRRNCLTKMAR